MNRGRCAMQAILLILCVMITLQGTSAQEQPCEHEFVQVELPGDCLNPGMCYRECIKCGEQIDFKNTPALGHDFDQWTTETPALCTEKGEQSRSCQRCGYREKRTISPAGHQYEDEVQEPTCTKRGKVYSVCQVCGDRNAKEELPALGHRYDEGTVTKEPTDRAMGRKTFTCLRCGDTRTENLPRVEKSETTAGYDVKKSNDRRKTGSSSKKEKQSNASFEDAMGWAEQNGISSGSNEEALSPDDICTRAQVVKALWQAAGAAEPDTTTCPFTDVSAEDDYYQAVLWAWENGITTGADDTHFDPDGRCTRSEVISFLYRAAGSPACKASERFKDVDRDDYFYWPVIWAIQQKMTKGVCRYQFGALQSCTWGQLVMFLHNIY